MPQRKQELPYLINCCKSRPLNFACIQGFNLDHFVLLSLVGHFTVPRDIHLEQEVKSVMLGTLCGASAFSQIELDSWAPDIHGRTPPYRRMSKQRAKVLDSSYRMLILSFVES